VGGNYWIKPAGYAGPARRVWVDFNRGGKSYVLIGKGRQSADNSGGWFGTDTELSVGGLLKENAATAGVSKLSSSFVNYLMNGTATGWTNNNAENYMVVNRITNAADNLGGVGDSFQIKVTGPTPIATVPFTWIDQFGSSATDSRLPTGTGTITRYPSIWLSGVAGATQNAFGDYFPSDDGQRLFTWHWDGHGLNHGWSAGGGETRGLLNSSNEGWAIQFVQLWIRS
jgi:hypothetical protein